MQTELAPTKPELPAIPSDVSIGALEAAVGMGDFGRLSSGDRLKYLVATCQSVGLNPMTKPIDIINIGGKVVLYANKGAAEQLRKIHNVTITHIKREHINGCYVVTVRAKDGHGREDEATGAVPCPDQAAPEIRCNAIMKAETKAKRRVTLSICGLGILDESELDTIRRDRVTEVTNGETAGDAAEALNAELVEESVGGGVEAKDGKDTREVREQAHTEVPGPGTIGGQAAKEAHLDQSRSGARPASSSPQETAPVAHHPTPGTPVATPSESATPAPAGLSFELESELAAVIGSDGAKALKWMRKEGWLKEDEGFDSLNEQRARRIIKNPAGFKSTIAKVQ